MRSKHVPRTRTRTHSREQHQQPRTWGTRFDSLDTSPPPAQQSSPVPSVTTSPNPDSSSDQLTHALSLELFGVNAKGAEKRDWADDDVPSTLFSPGRTPLVLNLASGSTPGRKELTKQPHNASVFVGSLPPDTDEAEMAQLLAQHLARFAKVQNIKIVHDSKGGLCAFVQCENAAQAAQLVSQAQANPQPFMGRYLRYENARARRTLWISYRTPLHFMPCSSKDEEGSDIVIDENGVKGRWIESDLPDALRIWKPRDVRYPIVTFRGEARNIGDASRFDKDAPAPDMAPAFQQKGILLTDFKCDAQTVRKMAEAFGSLESFKTLTGNDQGGETCAYPTDHSASRSPGMSLGVWEIKWEHRDDCITALNTLRRIPFLTVTWAKDAGHPQTPRAGFIHLRSPTSPRYPTSYTSRDAASPIARVRPFLLLDCAPGNDGGFRNTDSLPSASAFARSPSVLSPQRDQELSHKNESAHHIPEDETDEGWTVVRPQNTTRTIATYLSEDASVTPSVVEETEKKVHEWSEGDFPPLKPENTRPVEVELLERKEKEPVFISLNDQAPPKPGIEQMSTFVREETSLRGEAQTVSRPHLSHRRSLSNPVARLQVEAPQASPNAQAHEIPPTPELANSSLTQTPTTANPDLESPMYPVIVPLAGSGFSTHEQKPSERGQTQDAENAPSESGQSATADVGMERYDHPRQATVDPKTIFVGGLEPFGPRPWDESRLREIFEKYGEIQEVRIVIPSFKKAGFAFVTFVDEQSPIRAIREEHNRLYDGRQIRVQIRDMFPSRGFKFRGRGLGRRPFGFGMHHDGPGRYGINNKPIEHNSLLLANANKPFEHPFAYARGPQSNAPFQIEPRGPHQLVPSTSAGTNSSTLPSLNSFDSKTEVDVLHESDSKTAVSVTPPPSMLNASVSTSGLAAPITSQGMPSTQVSYYPPHAWVSPYGAQMHYPMPFGPYGGMIPPVHMPFASINQAVDSSATAGSTPMQWNTMYRSGVPIAPYPYMIVPPANSEAPRSATMTSSQPTTPAKSQPPLHATGFIQGEHGMLYPVYQPEALSDYLSGSSPTESTTASRISATASSTYSTGTQQPNFVTAQMWHGFPHAPQFIAYPVPPASAVGVTTSSTPPASVQQHTIHHQMHSQAPQAANPAYGSSMMPGVANLTHSLPVQSQAAPSTGSGATAQGMPHSYFVAAPSTGPHVVHRSGPHNVHPTHRITPERLNMYSNKHPPRRDPGFHHSRTGQYGHGYSSDISGARSPSAVRSSSGLANTSRADHLPNNHSFQQRQRQSSAAPPLQLGFNKHIPDGRYSQQQHQWTANPHQ